MVGGVVEGFGVNGTIRKTPLKPKKKPKRD
jgi:hypothetical protein